MDQRPIDVRDADAFRALRTALLFSPDGPQLRKIAVTGAGLAAPIPEVTAGLARAIAQSGARVVSVDCDFRNPRLHHQFGLSDGPGLAQLLEGSAAPLPQPVHGGGEFVGAGTPAPDSPEFLGSDRFRAILDLLLEEADHLLLNTPPVTDASEAAVVAARSDAVLLVVQAAHTSREAGRRAVALLRQVDAPLLGAVLIG